MRYFGPRGIVFLQAAAVDSSTGMDKVADKREKKMDSSICLVVHNQSDRNVPFVWSCTAAYVTLRADVCSGGFSWKEP